MALQNGCADMIHPIVTILFDCFLIGSTAAIVAGIAIESRMQRGPAVGAPGHRRTAAAGRPRTHSLAVRRRPATRRGVMARSS